MVQAVTSIDKVFRSRGLNPNYAPVKARSSCNHMGRILKHWRVCFPGPTVQGAHGPIPSSRWWPDTNIWERVRLPTSQLRRKYSREGDGTLALSSRSGRHCSDGTRRRPAPSCVLIILPPRSSPHTVGHGKRFPGLGAKPSTSFKHRHTARRLVLMERQAAAANS